MNRKQIKRVRGLIRKIASQVVREEVLKLYKCRVMGYNKRGQYVELNHYPCAKCGGLFLLDKVEIDHIKEVGVFKIEGKVQRTKYGDCRVVNWQEWMDRLFCDLSNFQVLCIECHQRKSLGFNDYLRYGGNLL